MKRALVKYPHNHGNYPAIIIQTHEDVDNYKGDIFHERLNVKKDWHEYIDKGDFLVVNSAGGYFPSSNKDIILEWEE